MHQPARDPSGARDVLDQHVLVPTLGEQLVGGIEDLFATLCRAESAVPGRGAHRASLDHISDASTLLLAYRQHHVEQALYRRGRNPQRHRDRRTHTCARSSSSASPPSSPRSRHRHDRLGQRRRPRRHLRRLRPAPNGTPPATARSPRPSSERPVRLRQRRQPRHPTRPRTPGSAPRSCRRRWATDPPASPAVH